MTSSERSAGSDLKPSLSVLSLTERPSLWGRLRLRFGLCHLRTQNGRWCDSPSMSKSGQTR
jgi:hypothetical protein